METGILIVSGNGDFFSNYKALTAFCAESAGLTPSFYMAFSERSALEAIGEHPDISLVVCDTLAPFGMRPDMADPAQRSGVADCLGPKIAGALRRQYPELRIIAVPCCDEHAKEWRDAGGDYTLLPVAGTCNYKPVEPLEQMLTEIRNSLPQ